MNSGMLPAKTLTQKFRVGITAAGPLLNLTGFPIKRYGTCDAHSLQKEDRENQLFYLPSQYRQKTDKTGRYPFYALGLHRGDNKPGGRSVTVYKVHQGPEPSEVPAVEINDETGEGGELRLIFFYRQWAGEVNAAIRIKYVMEECI